MTANLANTVAWLAFGLGFIFGAVANRTHFCTMGAISDVVNIGDWNRMRMWLLAIAVAIIGANVLHLLGLIDLSKSIYQTPNFTWLSYIVGGLLFGIGMTLASGCGSKTLVRIGAGNLKSIVVFIFLGISAYMTLRGLFSIWRVDFLDPVTANLRTGQDLPSLLTAGTGISKRVLQGIISAVIAGGLLGFVFSNKSFLKADYILGGVVVGLVVVAGWYVTGHIGYITEDPNTLSEAFVATNTGRAESFSFVAPLAYSLELLMFWTDTSRIITFGIAATVGIISGSFVYALVSKTFHWEGFISPSDTANHIIGAILMGFGGVTALGCTIGQGISGFSTLALGSMLTFLAIIAGSAVTMKYQYWKIMREA